MALARKLYSEMTLRHLRDKPGLMVNGNKLNNIRYANDTVLLADSIEKLQLLLGTVVEKSAEH